MNENLYNNIGLIPARYDSSRLPGKLLLPLGKESILQAVYNRASLCKTLNRIAVVTDHPIIYDHVQSWGGEVYMSQRPHQSGTDRIAEIAEQLDAFTHIVNIQGDEPFIEPMAVDYVVETVQSAQAKIGTLISRLTNRDDYNNPNVVKVVRDSFGYALYFSRASIPFHRDHPFELPHTDVFRHIGLYVFERRTLLELTKSPVSELESTEKLEQLRWLERGQKIMTAQMDVKSFGIDTKEDYEAALAFLT